MQLKTLLNRVQKYKGFRYGACRFKEDALSPMVIEVEVEPEAQRRPVCSGCQQPGPGYDRLKPRRFEFVPLWGIAVFFLYAMRRVECERCGVKVETVPWADGKSHLTVTYAWFLANWAKRLSWSEVAEVFRTSWGKVFRAVQMAVLWGRAHQDLSGICAIGVDEIAWHLGHKSLTLVYQIDAGCRRLIWIGKERTEATLEAFFTWFGPAKSAALKFVCSDMWKNYLVVIAKKASQAIHVLDRFHIMSHLNKAIDAVRAQEAKELLIKGHEPVLKKTRWLLLKRPEKLTERQEVRLRDLLRINLRTVRSYLLKEDFQFFWEYSSPTWAGKFVDRWCKRVMRSRIEPMKEVARMLRNHRDLLLNWFRAKGELSSGPVEGCNNKAKLAIRRAYGFRTYDAIEIALYHTLGRLPEPEFTHRFW
jgi:transposase